MHKILLPRSAELKRKDMTNFLSCDWGTSTFRLRLVEIPRFTIVMEATSAQGISKTFAIWNQSGKAENSRLSFYLDFILTHVRDFEAKLNYSLGTTPLLISGMAASTMGMMELPYKEFPFTTDGSDLITKMVEDKNLSDNLIVIISGAKTNDDVMRGEETQLVGCAEDYHAGAKSVFVFPGTHSKHILVANNKAINATTYMTGEFFDLLSTKSILSHGLEKGAGILKGNNRSSFEKGIDDSLHSNLLHSSFLVRTNALFEKYTKQENYYYLSGLLIGTEIKQLAVADNEKTILVANATLMPYYQTAFARLNNRSSLETVDADQALIRGQFNILRRLVQSQTPP